MMTTDAQVVKKMESFCTIGRNINCYSHYGKQYGVVSRSEK